jgi:biotin carboxylase
MSTLLIVSGGQEAVAGIQRARDLGHYVVVCDGDNDAPGFKYANERLLASTYDVAKCVAEAQRFHSSLRKIHGVLSVAADVPMTVAAVAHALGLRGIDMGSAILSSDKLLMKQKFSKDRIPIPRFLQVHSVLDIHQFLTQTAYPIVIKPVDSRGARGVLRVTEGMDLEWALNTSRQFSATRRVMVEEYLEGPQVSTESLMIDGTAYTPGFADRNYEFLDKYAPHIIENGGQLPSNLDSSTQVEVRELVEQAALSMGILNGVVKGDIVIFEGKAHVIELAARLSGGYFCTHEIPLNTGVDLVGVAIQQALAEPINTEDLKPRRSQPVAQRYLFPKPGKVMEIHVPEWISLDLDVAYFELRVKVGDVVPVPIHHPSRSGVVIATGTSVAEAINKAEKVISSIEVVTERV